MFSFCVHHGVSIVLFQWVDVHYGVFIVWFQWVDVRRVMALHAGARSLLDASVGVSDMCLLEPLDEDNFIDNLQRRFMHDQIYVSTVEQL